MLRYCSSSFLLVQGKTEKKKHRDWRFLSNSSEVRKTSDAPPTPHLLWKGRRWNSWRIRIGTAEALSTLPCVVRGWRCFVLKQGEAECWESWVDGFTQGVFPGHTEEGKGVHNPQAISKRWKPCTLTFWRERSPHFCIYHYQALHYFAQDRIRQAAGLGHLPWSCSQPERPVCTSHLHMASLCSGIQRKVYIIPHRGADVGFPEQQ